MYPEILAVAFTLFLWHYLNSKNAALRRRVYSKYVRIKDSHLQEQTLQTIEQRARFNWQKVVLLLYLAGSIYFLAYVRHAGQSARFCIGFLLGLFGIQLGRQIFNYLYFRYLERNPDAVEGEILYSGRTLYLVGIWEMFLPAPLVAVLVWQYPDEFSWGLGAGFAMLCLIQIFLSRLRRAA
ncbi:MAG TPA: hypothetical protein PKL15_05570 [Saprospiraceae bacterium]|nr:hypothetical protein [Saprospiraceae bacterium]HNM24876.1 hypothetical protein [Saprospiraceae bacterium]